MGLILAVLKPLEVLNVTLLTIARWLATALLAVMVLIITYQIIMRVISPAGWTIAAAKFMMLWMIGLAAPIGYRQGGFVGIDMLERALPRVLSHLLTLTILVLCGIVVFLGVQLGHAEINSFGGKGTIPNFRIELSWAGLKDFQVRNWHAFFSLYLGFCLMLLVNVELILRHIVKMMGGADRLNQIEGAS
ncbi:MAG: TRAP transporter small permease subunit [Pseudomonadota bacterium]